MHESNSHKCDLHLCKESIKPLSPSPPDQSKLPSGSISISTNGDQLFIRPPSPYCYKLTPATEELSLPLPTPQIKDEKLHQRSTTTIVNDISQSYTFIQTCQKDESFSENLSEDSSFEKLYNEMKDSVMASTMDPKSFVKKPLLLERFSTIVTVSSMESEEVGKKKVEVRHALFAPVTAYCSNCGKNVRTVVVKKRFVGSL